MNIPAGYRLIEDDEVIQEGDYYIEPSGAVTRCDQSIGKTQREAKNTYIFNFVGITKRSKENMHKNVPVGYRPVKMGERVKKGDGHLWNGQWKELTVFDVPYVIDNTIEGYHACYTKDEPTIKYINVKVNPFLAKAVVDYWEKEGFSFRDGNAKVSFIYALLNYDRHFHIAGHDTPYGSPDLVIDLEKDGWDKLVEATQAIKKLRDTKPPELKINGRLVVVNGDYVTIGCKRDIPKANIRQAFMDLESLKARKIVVHRFVYDGEMVEMADLEKLVEFIGK